MQGLGDIGSSIAFGITRDIYIWEIEYPSDSQAVKNHKPEVVAYARGRMQGATYVDNVKHIGENRPP